MTNHRNQMRMPALLLLGWVTYSFALFNVGRFSITIMLLTSLLMCLHGLKSPRLLTFSTLSLLLSGLIAWLVSFFLYGEVEKPLTHLIQYLLVIGVFISMRTLQWEEVFPRFRKLLFWLAALVLIYGAYQFFARSHNLPFAYLPITNLQLGADEGFQRGISNVALGAGIFTRVSSFFAEPSDLGRFMLWVFAVGYACERGRLRTLLVGLGITGILVSQSMGGVVGGVFLVGVITLLKRDLRRAAMFVVVGSLALVAVAYFIPQSLETLANRAETIASGGSERLLQRGRFADMGDNLRLFMEAPLLGHGLASVKIVAPDNVVASAWELLLIERGLLGTILFMAPFFVIFLKLGLTHKSQGSLGKTALVLLIVEMYSFATFSSVFFPVTYLALGLAVYAVATSPSSPTPLDEESEALGEAKDGPVASTSEMTPT